MSLASKLQAACKKCHDKIGTQEGPVIIRQKNKAAPAEFGRPYVSHTETDVTIESGVVVDWVKAYEADRAEKIRVDDLKLTIPGDLVTEAQLYNAVVIYKGKSHTIVSKAPTKIISGVAVSWRVIGRLEG